MEWLVIIFFLILLLGVVIRLKKRRWSADYWRPRAEQGDADAQYALGLLHALGRGASQNYEVAAKWYKRAAEQGHLEAQNNLGRLYEKGRGVPQDYEAAVEWYKRAIKQGSAKAESNLYGLRADERKLRKLEPLAEQGDADAQFDLGRLYFLGWGAPQDHEAAKKWLKRAAEQGHAGAQNALDELRNTGPEERC